jgi:peptide-methionine (R)-S-oxide reductase
MNLSDEEWRKRLSPEQFHILREKGTEVPGTGALLHNEKTGEYRCAACDNLLFDSSAKFKNGGVNGGWPSFNEAVQGSVTFVPDDSHGMQRTEVVCARCGGHLGHVFDEPSQTTGQDFCINSAALSFRPADKSGN